ncbi:arginine deiminase [Alkalibacterium sp. MB6]|uniref:arginine deiminase n=1 Tax=Alkalibacterium sp. MB6 TaxID=2081965 RepID=UPI00137A8FC5|nr:arginine deiminase [Alkalibacterium sp. MB6]
MNQALNITSEIGSLKRVLLRRPGKEVENLIPSTMEELLFDDIPYLPIIQEEHDAFATVLRDNGAEVVYLENLLTETLKEEKVKDQLISQLIKESGIHVDEAIQAVSEYFYSMTDREMVDKMMAGVRMDELSINSTSLSWLTDDESKSLFLMDPMPNLYYTRDIASVLGEGISINQMTYPARKRESLFMETIVKHHPNFKQSDIKVWRDRYSQTSIEGGDILVLNDEALAIGVSQRTSGRAIEEMARSLFSKNSTFKKVVAIEIPRVRAMMHLDTVFTMVDHDAFTIHPEIQDINKQMSIYVLEPSSVEGELNVSHHSDLGKVLKDTLKHGEINLIPCGDGDPIAAPREQWNDGSNTLAIKPGVVVTYNRNFVSNELLRENGIKVIEIPSSELSRGRGGPRCMSMPLLRDSL